MTVNDLIQKFLDCVEDDADIELCSTTSTFIVVHGNSYEEVIARGPDGVFVYAVPSENAFLD